MTVIQYVQNFYGRHPVVTILLCAIIAHFILKAVKVFSLWLLTPKSASGRLAIKDSVFRRYPRFGSILTILASTLTFATYFIALGFILKAYNVSLTAYFASASVIGLAIGFGTQGFVQDIVIGLTLIFSDALNVKDMVQVSGQTGRVEVIGLRFTVLTNYLGQKIFIPNRMITSINRYAEGCVRVYVDVQLPANCDKEAFVKSVHDLANAIYSQHRTVVLAVPENQGIKQPDGVEWSYLRLKFKIWPDQNSVIDTLFKQRLLAQIKAIQPDYLDWMLSITYRAQ